MKHSKLHYELVIHYELPTRVYDTFSPASNAWPSTSSESGTAVGTGVGESLESKLEARSHEARSALTRGGTETHRNSTKSESTKLQNNIIRTHDLVDSAQNFAAQGP